MSKCTSIFWYPKKIPEASFIYWKTLQKTRFDLCTDCYNTQTSKEIKPRKTTRMQIMSTVK